MPDSTREVQRYLNQPLDALMQDFDLYAETAAARCVSVWVRLSDSRSGPLSVSHGRTSLGEG